MARKEKFKWPCRGGAKSLKPQTATGFPICQKGLPYNAGYNNLRELDAISTQLANRYFLDDDVVEFQASDTAIKTVRVRKIAGKPRLANIESISTR